MKFSTFSSPKILLVVLLAILSVPTLPAQTIDDHWDARFGLSGVNGVINAVVHVGDYVYVGGTFTTAGTITTNNIARWNKRTRQWSPLGISFRNGVDGLVLSMVVYENRIIVGGQFPTAGAILALNLAAWDITTEQWSPFGDAVGVIQGYVATLLVDGSDLYAGGSFTSIGGALARNAAQWNGTAWKRMAAGLDGSVYAMTKFGNDIIAGGSFTGDGIETATNIARWNDTTWDAFGQGLNGDVHAVTVFKGELYAGGAFTTSGDSALGLVGRWDSDAGMWRSLGNTLGAMTAPVVKVMMPYGDSLILGGSFAMKEWHGADALHLAIWDGRRWMGLTADEDSLAQRTVGSPAPSINVIVADGAQWYVGGDFTSHGYIYTAKGYTALGIVAWDFNLQHWLTFGSSVNDDVNALFIDGDTVYAGGQFTSAGAKVAMKVALWDGNDWYPIGGGVDGKAQHSNGIRLRDVGNVIALGKYQGKLSVGGSFLRAGTVESPVIGLGVRSINFALWDGVLWDTLAAFPPSANPRAIAVDNDKLYIGGNELIVTWNDTGWVHVSGINGTVKATVVDAEGNLYIGGGFTKLGTLSVGSIARLDRATGLWSTMNNGVNDSVFTMALQGDTLYVGGKFTRAGGLDVARIAGVNLKTGDWFTLNEGVSNGVVSNPALVRAIAVGNDGVYVGGKFESAGAQYANNIARWTGIEWIPMGSGVDGVVNTIAIRGNDVYMGGEFTHAGNRPSFKFAHWNPSISLVHNDVPVTVNLTLGGNIPNPCQTTTSISYSIPSPTTLTSSTHHNATGNLHVLLTLHDVLGRELSRYVDDYQQSGYHTATIEVQGIAPGVYFYRLQVGAQSLTRSMVVVR